MEHQSSLHRLPRSRVGGCGVAGAACSRHQTGNRRRLARIPHQVERGANCWPGSDLGDFFGVRGRGLGEAGLVSGPDSWQIFGDLVIAGARSRAYGHTSPDRGLWGEFRGRCDLRYPGATRTGATQTGAIRRRRACGQNRSGSGNTDDDEIRTLRTDTLTRARRASGTCTFARGPRRWSCSPTARPCSQ